MAKELTDEEVKDIWRKKGIGLDARDLADAYGVSPESIRRIWRRDTHRTITARLLGAIPGGLTVREANFERAANESLQRMMKVQEEVRAAEAAGAPKVPLAEIPFGDAFLKELGSPDEEPVPKFCIGDDDAS